jgi:hypothetical protein
MILQVTNLRRRRTMYVLVEDEKGRLVLRRFQPWHRLLARLLAPRLDRKLAEGARPETAMTLAARAEQMTSAEFRRQLAASLRRLMTAPGWPTTPYVPVNRGRISRSAPELAELAGRLTRPGPAPAQGVAMVSQLLADGGGPLYRPASRDDLAMLIERAEQALAAA